MLRIFVDRGVKGAFKVLIITKTIVIITIRTIKTQKVSSTALTNIIKHSKLEVMVSKSVFFIGYSNIICKIIKTNIKKRYLNIKN
jgi:hypothetical protein